MRIKCCGITRVRDALFAEQAGADAIGVVLFISSSPRSVPVDRAREIFDAVGPFTATVAVTHTTSEEDLAQILALRPTAIQIFHPFVFAEDPDVKVIRAIKEATVCRKTAMRSLWMTARGAGNRLTSRLPAMQ